MRSKMRAADRGRKTVVFLDANIPGAVCFPLWDLKEKARWISFWAPRALTKSANPKQDFFTITVSEWREMNEFFESMGNVNVLRKCCLELDPPIPPTPPTCLHDTSLLSYMVHFVSRRCTDHCRPFFFTCDQKFLSQPAMGGHPLLDLFKQKFVPKFIIIPGSDEDTDRRLRSIPEIAEFIRRIVNL